MEKEELLRTMDDLAKKAEIVLRAKEMLTRGVEKKIWRDLIVGNRNLYDQLQSALKQGDATFFKTGAHVLYTELLRINRPFPPFYKKGGSLDARVWEEPFPTG